MLTVSIYRSSHGGRPTDCTNNGISATAEELTLVNVPGPVREPTDRAPAAMLVKHTPFGDHDGRRLVRVVPCERDGLGWKPTPRWTMFGGNFAGCSDGRFGDAVRELIGVDFYNGAVPIHDRIEG